MEQYNIRAYKPGDGLKLSSLFTKYSPYLRDDKFWVWINRFFTQKSFILLAKLIDINAHIIISIFLRGYIHDFHLGIFVVQIMNFCRVSGRYKPFQV